MRMARTEVMGIIRLQTRRVFTPEFSCLQINENEWMQMKGLREVSSPVLFLSPVELCWLWLPKG